MIVHNFHLHDHSAISDGGQSPTPGLATFAAFASAVAGGTSVGHLLFGSRLPRQPEDVVVFVAAVILCVIVGWFMVNVVSWTVALRRGLTLRRFTLPGTRRLAQVFLALSLGTACIAEADESPTMVLIEGEVGPTTVEARSGTMATSTALSSTMATSTAPTSTTATSTAPTSATPPPADEAPGEAAPLDRAQPSTTTTPDVEAASDRQGEGEIDSIPAHDLIVNRGDNLWSLSVETLQRHGIADPSASTVASYWRLVIAANNVRSGNPNLIVVGETIHMPAHGPQGSAPAPPRQTVAAR